MPTTAAVLNNWMFHSEAGLPELLGEQSGRTVLLVGEFGVGVQGPADVPQIVRATGALVPQPFVHLFGWTVHVSSSQLRGRACPIRHR
ncbi:hypothetical protein ABZY57_21905, partial [Streptomyces sp. NPDC006450]|uniref:hypothetical protein n=1 Tax=Streptomyces sp. NPDC006450 TaxID=3155458 RepID=UPI0033B50944